MEYQHPQIDPSITDPFLKPVDPDVDRLLWEIKTALQAVEILVQEGKSRLPVIDLDE